MDARTSLYINIKSYLIISEISRQRVNKENMMFPFISPKHEGVARIQWIKWLLLWNDWAVMRLLCEIVGQNIFASHVRWNGEICQKSAFAKLLSMQSLLVCCFQSKIIPSDTSELTLLIFTNSYDGVIWFIVLWLCCHMLVTITPQWFERRKQQWTKFLKYY